MKGKTKISINEIKKKLNDKKAIIDFFREQGKKYNYIILIQAYIIQILTGHKKVQSKYL